MLFSLLLSSAFAQDMRAAQTSYTGAIMLQPEIDLSFGSYEALDGNTQDAYAYFNGNSLYIGHQDEDGNRVDGIVNSFGLSFHRSWLSFLCCSISARSNPAQGQERDH